MEKGRIRTFCLAALIKGFYSTLSLFWRVRHVRRPTLSLPTVFAHWHGDELALIGPFSFSKIAVMSSLSRDGALMAKVLEWFGYHVVRGSSHRGGVAGLKGLIEKIKKEKFHASLAVDGPRGPIYRAKGGAIALAQQTGAPIVPGAVSASCAFAFRKSWNQCFLPLPFSRCVIVYGDPIAVPHELTADQFEKLRRHLESQLLELKNEADGYFTKKTSANLPKHA